MTANGVPSGFGYQWRDALFAAGAPADAVRIGWVLVDVAYSQRSTTVQLGQRLLRDQTALDGRSLDRGRTWLMTHGFVVYDPRPGGRGGSRSTYTLLLQEATAIRGRFADEVPAEEVPADRGRLVAKATAEATAIRGHELELTPTTNSRSNEQLGTTPSDVTLAREDTTDDDAFLAALRPTREDRPSPFVPPALVAARVGDGTTLDQALYDPALYARFIEPVTRCHVCLEGDAELPAIFHGSRLAVCRGCVETYPPIAQAVRDAAVGESA